MVNSTSPTVYARFFKPLTLAIRDATHTRECGSFKDNDFLISGVSRVVAAVQSGRDWVQRLYCMVESAVTVNCFFKSLRSERRLRMVTEVAGSVAKQCDDSTIYDPFAEHPELENFNIYAGDGHYHSAAVHEKKIEGRACPVQHFYAINMRSGAMHHLDVARILPGKKREHDMKALKRLDAKVLRMGTPTGRKVLWSYDRACIDFSQWIKWKRRGIYFITREKENMNLQVLSALEFDSGDPRNAGVVSDQSVQTSKGTNVRRIIYLDPVNETTYYFITNEFTVPPGVLAFIYKERWNIEKAFDEVKNKYQETKAWATTDTAKCQQAKFIALAYNLLLIFERHLEKEEGIIDEKIKRKRQAKLKDDIAKAAKANRKMSTMLTAPKRATQRSLQFIRWLRAELEQPTLWREALVRLRPLMKNYLS